MPPSLKVNFEMVPSLSSREHLAGGEDFLDRVSIPESLITYSPEVKVVLIEATSDDRTTMQCLGRK